MADREPAPAAEAAPAAVAAEAESEYFEDTQVYAAGILSVYHPEAIYEFIGFGGGGNQNTYEFMGILTTTTTKPYEFTGFWGGGADRIPAAEPDCKLDVGNHVEVQQREEAGE